MNDEIKKEIKLTIIEFVKWGIIISVTYVLLRVVL